MNTKTPIVAEQTPTVIEQGSSPLAVKQWAEERIERISEERIYEETAKVTAIFGEWRQSNDTLLCWMAAIIALIGWLYQQVAALAHGFAHLLLLGAAFSLSPTYG